jgi:YesN/AraC family two-component response regulator
VWQSFVVLTIIMLMLAFYMFDVEGPGYEFIIQVLNILLVGYLLWRVETLSDLSISHVQADTTEENTNVDSQLSFLLQQHCEAAHLYLQHDLTVTQLAQKIGTNRTYLGQYFSRQDTTYNAYINSLRINHFICLYREAVASQRTFTAQQLAIDSGYRSYSTFSLAFKQRMGESVTAWMRHPTD